MKYDWAKLKAEFFGSDALSVAQFLRDKGMDKVKINRSYTLGWLVERDKMKNESLTAASKKTINEETEDLMTARLRQARLSRYLQMRGAEALKAVGDPKTIGIDDARKLVVSGMEQERRALGIEGGGTQNLTQINIGPKTSVDKLLAGLNYEGILRLLAELRRERSSRSGGQIAGGSSDKVSEGEII